jgi:DNA-binding response OmpR family regulator
VHSREPDVPLGVEHIGPRFSQLGGSAAAHGMRSRHHPQSAATKRGLQWMAKICRILVIEDHPGIRTVVGEALQQRGYDFLLLSSRENPRALLARERHDIAIIDVPLEADDGFELAQLAQQNSIPLILTTANDKYVPRVTASGHAYLLKPFMLDELLAKVDAVVRRFHLDCVRRRSAARRSRDGRTASFG